MGIDLNLKLLDGAKICDKECVEKHDNGELEKLSTPSIVKCVGCGRQCHMECHKVPMSLSKGIKEMPQNNRVNAFFHEHSYLRIVCDNCANWLMTDVGRGNTPSFLLLFTRMVDKIIKDKYMLKSDYGKDIDNQNVADNQVAQTGQSGQFALNTRKRKKLSGTDDDDDENSILSDMRNMMLSCMDKLENMDKKFDANLKHTGNGLYLINKVVESNQQLINRNFTTICDSTHNINEKLSSIDGKIDVKHSDINEKLSLIDGKIDVKHGDIESGLQKGFNNLMDKTEKLLSPMTPNRFRKIDPLRKKAIMQSARKISNTPHTRAYADLARSATSQTGSSTQNDLFGAVIPRKLFIDEENGKGPSNGFRHEKAIYLRYVDPLVTPSKMINILNKDIRINEAINKNNGCIEITRLTKKGISEDEIKALRFGVSYRIGAEDSIFDIIGDGSLFAPHWEIRNWIDKGRKRFERSVNEINDVDDNVNKTAIENRNDFLIEKPPVEMEVSQ